MAETTAVVQLQNPAQPLPTGPVPETGSQEESCTPAGHWEGVDTTGWSRARLGSALCAQDYKGELCRVTVTREGSGGRRLERALVWESGNGGFSKILPLTHCVTCISSFPLRPLVKLELSTSYPGADTILGNTAADKAESPLSWSFLLPINKQMEEKTGWKVL